MNNTNFLPKLIALSFSVCLSGAVSAASLDIATTPLFVSADTEPNVMLLIDNSGSMDHIDWHEDFDSTIDYAGSYSTNGSYSINSSGWYNLNGGSYRLPHPAGTDGHNTRYLGNYLNWISGNFVSGTDLTNGLIPNQTRMQVARTAATNLVDSTDGVRLGVSSFNFTEGGRIDAPCGSTAATVKDEIATLRADNWTPLAESLYEVTRYFRGLTSAYGSSIPGGGNTYTSPIQYRCQKNFSIVITDGLPTYDISFPNDDPADLAVDTASLPNWDGLAPATPISVPQVYPQHSDGHGSGDQSNEGYSLYLDDIAKFGWDIDMKTNGTDNAGGNYQDELFPLQSMATYTIGFAVSNQMLQDAADYGNGQFYTANNADALVTAMQSAITDAKIQAKSSASAVATNSTRLDAGVNVFQARFNSQYWSGEFFAYGIDENTGEVDFDSPEWKAHASTTMPASGNRNIYTYKDDVTKGIPFLWNSLTVAQQANLNDDEDQLNYLRGDTTNEERNGGTLRDRLTSDDQGNTFEDVLGDIVNSNPVFVGTQDFGYKNLPDAEGTDYRTFRSSDAYKNRLPMLYVGANDGMLHGFNANDGVEKLAYIPSVVFPNLSALTDPNYTHQYYVDGTAHAGDAYLNGAWKTVLLGATGAGGRSVFALDITNPANFNATKVMWEFTSDNDADLGYTIGKPSIVRLNDGSWVAIVANGYNSTNHHAVLFILDLATGSKLYEFDTGVGSLASPNGLSTPIPVDTNGDRITDLIYAGDLQGKLWKFDLSDANTAKWGFGYKSGQTPAPLFTATDAGGTPQPITVRPEVGTHPDGGLMVFFGTGKYFENGDDTVGNNPQVHTFYGIWDLGVVSGRDKLQEQTILYEIDAADVDLVVDGTDPVDTDVRVVSNTTVDWEGNDKKLGWYLDLESPDGPEGERNVTTPVLRAGRIIFTTLIPSTDPCGFGGEGWLMELDAFSGGRLTYSVYDMNGDGEVNDKDFMTITLDDGTQVQLPVSGLHYDDVLSSPTVVSAGEVEHKYISGSSGNITHVTEIGDPTKGRQSWRQLQ